MNQTMPKKLPTFKGHTVDYRLREFRKVDRSQPSIEFVPFNSEEGQKLLRELESSKGKTNQQWYPYETHGSYYRLVDGVLQFCPMNTDGSMSEDEAGDVAWYEMQFEHSTNSYYKSMAEELLAIKLELETKD